MIFALGIILGMILGIVLGVCIGYLAKDEEGSVSELNIIGQRIIESQKPSSADD